MAAAAPAAGPRVEAEARAAVESFDSGRGFKTPDAVLRADEARFARGCVLLRACAQGDLEGVRARVAAAPELVEKEEQDSAEEEETAEEEEAAESDVTEDDASAALSRRSSLTTAASASGLTPDSVSPTSTVSVSRSRPVFKSCEMSKRTACAWRRAVESGARSTFEPGYFFVRACAWD